MVWIVSLVLPAERDRGVPSAFLIRAANTCLDDLKRPMMWQTGATEFSPSQKQFQEHFDTFACDHCKVPQGFHREEFPFQYLLDLQIKHMTQLCDHNSTCTRVTKDLCLELVHVRGETALQRHLCIDQKRGLPYQGWSEKRPTLSGLIRKEAYPIGVDQKRGLPYRGWSEKRPTLSGLIRKEAYPIGVDQKRGLPYRGWSEKRPTLSGLIRKEAYPIRVDQKRGLPYQGWSDCSLPSPLWSGQIWCVFHEDP